MNENIQNIIQKRNANNNNNDNPDADISKPITIKSLSSSIINEIGSYLWLNEIVKMERINRMFFVSLRYPYPALQNIAANGKINIFNWMEEYCKSQIVNQMPLDFQRFKSMNMLIITSDQFIKHKIDTLGRLFNKVNILAIISESIDATDQILNSNICNFSSIKQLRLSFYSGVQLFCVKSYLKMLSMSKHLKGLSLMTIKCNDKIANEVQTLIHKTEIQQKLSKLEVFIVRDSRLELYKSMLDIISHQIISLHVTDSNALINIKCDPKYIGFPKLKEFCFKGSRNNITIVVNEVMKSAKHLQKIAIRFLSDNQSMNNNEQTNFIKAMNNILSINSLRMIRLSVSNNNFLKLNILNILESAIMNSNMNNQQSLEIVIFGMDNPLSNTVLSLIKTIRLWRQNFAFVLHSKNRLTNEVKIKLSKIATIGLMKGGYIMWNKTQHNAFDYEQNSNACTCTCDVSLYRSVYG